MTEAIEKSTPILEVDDLHTTFHTHEGVVRAVDGISYRLDRGEVLGVVGDRAAARA
jgi:ABC-type dipeptide/oligopeptide/nickel transport system ATPase component